MCGAVSCYRSFPTQLEAKAWVAEQLRALRRREWLDPANATSPYAI